MRRRAALAAISVPVGLALLLGIEVLLAVNAERLPDRPPFELSGAVGPSSDAGAEPLRIAWIGDSVAAGVGASAPRSAVPRLVAEGLDRAVELEVFAMSGERVAGALADQLPQLESLTPPPDVIVVEIGANDVTHLTGRGTFREAYDTLLDRAARVGARHVLALGMPAFGTSPRFLQPLRAIVAWRSRRLDAEVETVAAAHGATYVDIAGATGPAFAADPERFYADDAFHPSDAGYLLWADAVLTAIRGSSSDAQASPSRR